jgi:hypothetical protein
MNKELLRVGAHMLFSQELAMFKSLAPPPVVAASCADKHGTTKSACAPENDVLNAPKFSAELMRMLSRLVMLR